MQGVVEWVVDGAWLSESCLEVRRAKSNGASEGKERGRRARGKWRSRSTEASCASAAMMTSPAPVQSDEQPQSKHDTNMHEKRAGIYDDFSLGTSSSSGISSSSSSSAAAVDRSTLSDPPAGVALFLPARKSDSMSISSLTCRAHRSASSSATASSMPLPGAAPGRAGVEVEEGLAAEAEAGTGRNRDRAEVLRLRRW